MNQTEGFFTLIQEARQMLLDRSHEEAKLIYYVAKMEADLRAAIILAYQSLEDYQDNPEELYDEPTQPPRPE